MRRQPSRNGRRATGERGGRVLFLLLLQLFLRLVQQDEYLRVLFLVISQLGGQLALAFADHA